jgi:hypothetical protein
MIKSDFILSGVFAASLTPLTKELDPNVDKLIGHANWLFRNGCDGVAILGTTGEANSFSLKQRMDDRNRLLCIRRHLIAYPNRIGRWLRQCAYAADFLL